MLIHLVRFKCHDLGHFVAMVAAQESPHFFIESLARFDGDECFRFYAEFALPMVVAFDFLGLHTGSEASLTELCGELACFLFARRGGVDEQWHFIPLARIVLYRWF